MPWKGRGCVKGQGSGRTPVGTGCPAAGEGPRPSRRPAAPAPHGPLPGARARGGRSFTFYRDAVSMPTSPSTLQLDSFFHYLRLRISPYFALCSRLTVTRTRAARDGTCALGPLFQYLQACDLGRVVSALLATGFLLHIGLVVEKFLRGSLALRHGVGFELDSSGFFCIAGPSRY